MALVSCKLCAGTGTIIDKGDCRECDGTGAVDERLKEAKRVEAEKQQVALAPLYVPRGSKADRVDMFGLVVLVVQLLDRIVAEMRFGTPSHTWNELQKIYEDVRRLRAELEEMTE
jgi:hypothetical protein